MKKFMLICAPVSSRSGYGDHARDLVRSFIKHDKYDVKIFDVNWGETPRAIYYEYLTAPLIKIVKDLKDRIEVLEAG